MKRFIGRVPDFARSFWRDTSGIMLPYVAMILTVIVGFSLLAIDGARYMSMQTQMQAAADALALAGARELNQRPGAQARAISAMANTAFGNDNTLFGMGTAPTFTYTYTFYASLPAATAGITGTAPTGTQDQMDLATKYVAVSVTAPTPIQTIFPATFFSATASNTFTTGASAIAGFTAVTACGVTPIFMCNPYETSGMTDTQATQALISVLDPHDPAFSAAALQKLFRLDTSKTSPGHFGWVVTADCSNSSASCMRTDIAKTSGACYTSFTVTLATGNKNVEQYFDTRFDIYSQNPAPTINSVNAPSINVRKGYVPGSSHDWCSATPEYASSAAMGTADYTAPMTVTTGTTTSASTSITNVASTANIVVGDATHPQYVFGAGIPFGTTVTSISGTTVVMSAAATGANTGLTFYLPTPANSPGIGQCFITTNGSTTLTAISHATTGNTTKNKNTLTNVANINCIAVGQTVTGTHIPANTTVTLITPGTGPTGNTVTMSNSMSNGTSSDQTGINLTFSGVAVSVGQFVAGPGIPANTTVASIPSSTSITISNNATANSANVNLAFFWLESALLHDSAWTGVCDNGFCSQGNGDWNCLLYWKANHLNAAVPSGCTASAPTKSRYQIYRYEIANNLINDWSGNHSANTTGNAGNGENGAPFCAAASSVSGVDTTTGGTDRRNIIVPIINCLAQAGNITGGANSQVAAAAFGKFFMTQPWSATQDYLYGEMTGLVTSGDHVTILNQVQLYR